MILTFPLVLSGLLAVMFYFSDLSDVVRKVLFTLFLTTAVFLLVMIVFLLAFYGGEDEEAEKAPSGPRERSQGEKSKFQQRLRERGKEQTYPRTSPWTSRRRQQQELLKKKRQSERISKEAENVQKYLSLMQRVGELEKEKTELEKIKDTDIEGIGDEKVKEFLKQKKEKLKNIEEEITQKKEEIEVLKKTLPKNLDLKKLAEEKEKSEEEINMTEER